MNQHELPKVIAVSQWIRQRRYKLNLFALCMFCCGLMGAAAIGIISGKFVAIFLMVVAVGLSLSRKEVGNRFLIIGGAVFLATLIGLSGCSERTNKPSVEQTEQEKQATDKKEKLNKAFQYQNPREGQQFKKFKGGTAQ